MDFVHPQYHKRGNQLPSFPQPARRSRNSVILRMDEIHFTPAKKPWKDDSPVNTHKLWCQPWCQSGAKWISSIHSITNHHTAMRQTRLHHTAANHDTVQLGTSKHNETHAIMRRRTDWWPEPLSTSKPPGSKTRGKTTSIRRSSRCHSPKPSVQGYVCTNVRCPKCPSQLDVRHGNGSRPQLG